MPLVYYFNLFRFYNLKQKTIKGGVGFIGYGFRQTIDFYIPDVFF